jgi:hypothetical protein
MAQAYICPMKVICLTGTRGSSSRHFTLQILAYQSVSLTLAILNYWRLPHIWHNIPMIQFIEHLHLKSRILNWHLRMMVMLLPLWILIGCHIFYERHEDCHGTHNIDTFFGVDYLHDMQMVCLIQLDDTEFLVVPKMLNFSENLDIASIPQTDEVYYEECHYLHPSDLEQNVCPQMLSAL